jgi:serine/threonine protein phosphatase 1
LNKVLTIEHPKKAMVISDIHGFWQALQKITELPEYHNPEYQLIFLGDYTDGGASNPRDPKKVIDFITDEVLNHDALLVHGNHDDMLLGTANNQMDKFDNWSYNGRSQTLRELGIPDSDDIEVVSSYLKDLLPDYLNVLNNAPYLIEDQNRIFVHAGINWYLSDYKKTTREDMVWLRQEYLFVTNVPLGFATPGHPVPAKLIHQNQTDKVIFTGHTPASLITGDAAGFPAKLESVRYGLPRYVIDGGSHGTPNAGLNVVIVDADGSIIRTEKLFG